MAEVAMLPLDEFGFQVCRQCGQQLPLSDFSRIEDSRLGYRKKCKKCLSRYSRRWALDNPDRSLNTHLLRRYGITLEQYNALLDEQGGVCAICGALPTSIRNRRTGDQRRYTARLVVDHDHVTGNVRGLLCSMCNTGIGLLSDNAELLATAIAYLGGLPDGR